MAAADLGADRTSALLGRAQDARPLCLQLTSAARTADGAKPVARCQSQPQDEALIDFVIGVEDQTGVEINARSQPFTRRLSREPCGRCNPRANTVSRSQGLPSVVEGSATALRSLDKTQLAREIMREPFRPLLAV